MENFYRFKKFEVLVVERQVRSVSGHVVQVGSRAFDVLLALIERRGKTVSKKELLHAVWKGLVVDESNVQVQVSMLREQLGADIIATVPGQGYCLSVNYIEEDMFPHASPIFDTPDARRIAVLPFRTINGSTGLDIVANGVTHDVISELSHNSDLRVVSHHSRFAFTEQSVSLTKIGIQLRARYLIDGTLEWQGNQFNIYIELLDMIDDQLIWAYQKTILDFELKKVWPELVRKIAGCIHTRSLQAEVRRIVSSFPQKFETPAQTWRASGLLTHFTAQATREARNLLEQAVQANSGDCAGWAWLGYLNVLDTIIRITGEWHPGRASEYIGQLETALALDPENATACRALSFGYRVQRNFDASLAAATRGIEVAPSNANCMLALAEAQCTVGNTPAALQSIENALDLYLHPPAWVYAVYSGILWADKRLNEALTAANNALIEMPHFWPARLIRMYTLHELGQKYAAAEEALIILRQLPRLSTTALINYWKNDLKNLRTRVLNAAMSAGIPSGRHGEP